MGQVIGKILSPNMSTVAQTNMSVSQLHDIHAVAQSFRLLDLPPEILDEILVCLIRSRELTIFRTCRLIYERQNSLLCTNAIFRIDMKSAERPNSNKPSSITCQAAAMAQSLEINMDLSADYRHFDSDWNDLRSFTGDMITRNLCQITLTERGYINKSGNELWQDYLFMRELATFETVSLEIVLPENEPLNVVLRIRLHNKGPNGLLTVLCSEMRKLLERWLGPAKWQSGRVAGSQYLVFRPRAYQEAIKS